MIISKLWLKNYRNLKEGHFNFGNQINYIYGMNAQGKTNLLESIWMFTGARSFRKSKDSELINFQKEYAKIEGDFFFENRNQKISVNFADKRRKIFLNGIPTAYPTEMIGRFRAVLFTPHHLSLVRDGPENRRKFLDSALCQLDANYVREIVGYNKILKHRNALLKQIQRQTASPDFLDVWNEKLIQTGYKILKRRLEYIQEINVESTRIYSEISNQRESLKIRYVSSIVKNSKMDCISKDEIIKSFADKLKSNESLEINQGFTLVGPHKDDIEMTIQDLNLKKFGSQGQQRSVVLSLKLAEATVLRRHIGEFPVVLLDDIMSELDDFRIDYIMSKLNNYQTFITGCNKDTIKYFNDANIFHIDYGGLL